ncbi:MAG: DUF4399 domain-containing protein [Gammaproteobacteria bacterium]|nr:DUF4399 domain-containing protein [Gammaproteobacteria bacterium]
MDVLYVYSGRVILKKLILSFLLVACSGSAIADSGLSSSAPGSKVYVISPQGGETVSSPVLVRFGLSGMGVAPSGVVRVNTGHHHLLIDMKVLPDLKQPLVGSDNLRHFGKGQTEAELMLSPGEHTLQLVLADHAHTPHSSPLVSERITIHVK